MKSPQFDNSYQRLPPQFYSVQAPTPVIEPGKIRINQSLAAELSIDQEWLASEGAIEAFAGNVRLEGSEPISTVYAGHQFGGWNPQLGDGRAVLLGEVLGDQGKRFDIQLKGGGKTPYSRNGDGRSPLGPVLREYILSEAMSCLGVPTTRSLAAVTTGETVVRETFLPGAILTRVASSHIRIGTFQYFAARGDTDSVRQLFEYAAKRHFPESLEGEVPALAFFNAVLEKQAELIAKWQLLGFIHGVMNTDNMLICGETVDYGPCAFMDAFDPNAVFSSIDRGGRYAYSSQPGIAHWNLSWLAQSLMPLIDDDQDKAISLTQEAIDLFPDKFDTAYERGLANKLGFSESGIETKRLGTELLKLMAEESADFTLCFRKLADLSAPDSHSQISDEVFQFPESFAPWLEKWRSLLDREEPNQDSRAARIRSVNPAFIPRNHLVEETIQAAQNESDFSAFHRLIELLEHPYAYDPERVRYALPPNGSQRVYQTFCGT